MHLVSENLLVSLYLTLSAPNDFFPQHWKELQKREGENITCWSMSGPTEGTQLMLHGAPSLWDPKVAGKRITKKAKLLRCNLK